MEIWKDIKGYEGIYQVSNLGNVKRKNKRILKGSINRYGYKVVRLSSKFNSKTITVHKLVANEFIPNPNNLYQINHKDENKLNNNANNLEWCNAKYNCNYGTRNKRLNKPILQFDLNNNLIKKWNSAKEIEKILNIPNSNICECCKGRKKTAGGFRWKYEEVIKC